MATRIGVAGHIIKRPRLTRILDETEARIILLCAPAGYGKTTLAREWVATREEPVLWYSGGPAMADVAALAVDLAELFGGVDSELVERVRFLASRGEEPRTLAKALATEAPDEGTLLVVDDYHHANSSEDANELIRELIHQSAHRLLINSRVRPGWLEPRSLIYGEATVLGTSTLSFTAEETGAVLRAPESAPIARTNGWPALVGLAALRGAQSSDAALTPTELYDFFASDLFSHASEELREVALVLALGGVASRDVAREVVGSSLERHLKAAIDAGILSRAPGGWIEMHPLLRNFLLEKVEEFPVMIREQFIDRVVASLIRHSRWDECLSTLERFVIPSLVIRTAEAALPDLLASGRTATVRQWRDLSRKSRQDHPIFALCDAEVALREGRVAEAQALAERAARLAEGETAARAFLTAARAAHMRDDWKAATASLEQAEGLALTPALRGDALWLSVASAYEMQSPNFNALLEKLVAVGVRTSEDALRLTCARAYFDLENSGPRVALDAAIASRALLPRVPNPLLRTNYLNVLTYLSVLAADYQAALDRSEDLEAEAVANELDFVVEHALLRRAAALVGLRKLGEAQRVLRQLEKRVHPTNDHVIGNMLLIRARTRIAARDLAAASLLLERDLSSLMLPTLRGECHAWRGLISAARGMAEDAEASLERGLQASQQVETRAVASLARSILAARGGRGAEASQTIERVIDAGHLDAIVHTFRAYPELLEIAVKHGLGDKVQRVLEGSRDEGLGRRAGLAMPREFRRGDGLSPREREVYELLVQGLSNPEIAAALYISQSTAKVHVRHIYEKLGVHSRAEAAAASIE